MIFLELFLTFFLIGIFTFGGGYAMIPLIQEKVLTKGWMTYSELSNFIAISEMTPGPIAINMSTFVGSKLGGFLGALCATLGVVLPSFIIIILVAIILNKFISNRFVKGALKGVRPVVLSLILGTAILFFIKAIFFSNNLINFNNFYFDKKALGIFIIVLASYLMYKKITNKKMNPIIMLLVSGFIGLLVY